MDLIFGKAVTAEFIDDKLEWDSDNAMKVMSRKIAKAATQKVKKCPLCSSTKSKKFFGWYGYNYMRCQKCDLIYSDRRISDEKSISFYSEDKDYNADYIYTSKKYLKSREKIIEPKIDFIRKYSKGKNWLDIGSADGASIQVIKKKGFYGVGIEISKKSRDFAKKYRNVDLYPNPIEEFAKETNKKWNVISIIGVMDVLPNPLEVMRVSHEILAKDGIIVINVPNYESGSTLIQKLIKEPDRHLGNDVMRAYNLKSLKYALNNTGFQPLAAWYFGMDAIELLKYLRRDKKLANSEIFEFLKHKTNDIQEIFDKEKMGDQILIVARKK